jgi:ABC-type multidrug transport system fused ATPase/permease subunit
MNGVDIREYDEESLRRRIGIMFQHFQPYAFPAKENIGCGCVDKMADLDRIVTAARRACADDFIQELPEKYDTPLSRIFSGGQDLSGGQWQRISLARLFMKDAPVVVFDEPCASLDVETEAALLKDIRAVISPEKLCIIISHRMFRPNLADSIVVLSQGEVLEQGKYDDLVASNGEFARLRELFYQTGKVGTSVLSPNGRLSRLEITS